VPAPCITITTATTATTATTTITIVPCPSCAQVGALGALVEVPGPARDIALGEFFEKWRSEPLVILKWLSLQVCRPARSILHGLPLPPLAACSTEPACGPLPLPSGFGASRAPPPPSRQWQTGQPRQVGG